MNALANWIEALRIAYEAYKYRRHLQRGGNPDLDF